MGTKTRKEYFESIKKQKPDAYLLGEKVEEVADNPQFWTGMNSVAGTYDTTNDPAISSWTTTKSPLTNETVSRWTHIPRSMDDAVKRVELMRETIHRSFCVARCLTLDGGMALWSTTWDIDQKHGTNYHKRFTEYWKYVENNDLGLALACTDVKGDRMKRPSEQVDPDMYLHIVERRDDGIVVRGAKMHITGAIYANEVLVIPTRDMRKEEAAYAIAFAIPIETKGLTLIGRPAGSQRNEGSIERPIGRKAGHVETLMVFENVFVPWERVFMAGEWDFAAPLVLTFASTHRWTKCACKSAQGDMMVGAAALAAEVNGVERAGHVQEKIADLIITTEVANACAYSACCKGKLHPSGVFIPDALPSNVGKYVASHEQGTEWIILHDIAGGLVVTLPTEKDWENPVERQYMEKYFKGSDNVNTETRIRIMKLIEDLTSCEFAGWSMGIGLNGAGSPIAEKIEILRRYNVKGAKSLMRVHANVPEPPPKPPKPR